MTKEELAWAAGFIEGEGCVGVWTYLDQGKYTYKDPMIEAYNTDLSILKELQRILRGKIYLKAKAGPNYGSHYRKKDYYRWQVHRKEALRVAKLIVPYMRGEKKEAVEKIIEHYES